MLHAAVQRPDMEPTDYSGWAVDTQWDAQWPVSSRQGRSIRLAKRLNAVQRTGESTFKKTRAGSGGGFAMIYERDDNYQMFTVVGLTRWWSMLRIATSTAGRSPELNVVGRFPELNGQTDLETVAVIVCAEPKPFLRNILALLASALPLSITIVQAGKE